ncbi:hypothetical protein [Roseiterribacter gracilis]|uniref:DUF1579 domain-containing protein n=1 Tax=Roseiterribacter gracilis TaxID=2812848 RepID=A0A8S8XIS9_9PROT|nr:hypothetical protein TMPK1_33930 [Rhodospirillales bacterium TMPK1]
MKRRTLVAAFALLAVSLSAQAQEAAPRENVARTKMQALDFLTGVWEGEGWILMGPQRRNFRQREIARMGAGETVLVVDGKGLGADADNKGKVEHAAFAVVNWNAATSAYRWQAFKSDGASVDVVPQVSDKKLVWELPPNNDRRVRFTITRDNDSRWHEIGESWTGDGKPVVFLDMTLRRVGDAPK